MFIDPSALLDQLRDDSEIAFKAIYDLYWEDAYLSALKRLRDEDVAKEITQELFISLWEKRKTLVIHDSLSAYLRTAIKFRVLNHFKSVVTREKYHHDLVLLTDTYETNPAESAFSVKEIEDQLALAMQKMPERMRLIFAMSRLQQKQISEISSELHLSGQTVKNQLSSAMKILRKYFTLPLLLLLFILS